MPSSRNAATLPLLWFFAFLSYVLRTNIAVAQQFMAHEFGWSDTQVGWVFTAFLVAYTIFQVPAGMLGDRYGAYLVFTVSGLWWCAATLLSAFLPGTLFVQTALALPSLIAMRFLLGVGEATTYPVITTAVRDRYPPERHAFISAVIWTGTTSGSAFAPPLVAFIMLHSGWRATFYVTAVLPLLAALAWWRFAKGGSVGRVPTKAVISGLAGKGNGTSWRLLKQPSLLFLCTSYLLYCYTISIFVYWLFKYLVDVRRLSILNSSWATSVPWIAASVCLPLVGWLSTVLAKRFGSNLAGRRATAVPCLLIAAGLVFVVAASDSMSIALLAIAASVALLFSTESSYWSTAIELAPQEAGASSGLMNFAGNGGGVLATSMVPVLVAYFGWYVALVSGSVLALLAALFWFLIKVRQPISMPNEVASFSEGV